MGLRAWWNRFWNGLDDDTPPVERMPARVHEPMATEIMECDLPKPAEACTELTAAKPPARAAKARGTRAKPKRRPAAAR